ncbi:Dual oxidase maturation factor 1 [Nymphon striatum]|nr:Dual oxidase maturation factor 1 [Nymphon striatum]
MDFEAYEGDLAVFLTTQAQGYLYEPRAQHDRFLSDDSDSDSSSEESDSEDSDHDDRVVSNFGMGWESSEIATIVQYKAGRNSHINATIGIWFGLRGVNVTLKGQPMYQMGEQIDYNEHFSWAWRQGKPGFGPDAGILQQQFREAQKRGIPYPITWVIEYLTYDGDGLRYGRCYRIAGWYSHILLWLSLPLWILSNILMFMVIRYAAFFMGLTGTSMVLSCIVYSCVRNPGDVFSIRFEEEMLKPTLGWCFYATLITDSNEGKVPEISLGPSEGTSNQGNGVPEKSDRQKLQVVPVQALRKRTTSVRFQKSRRRITLLDPHTVVSDKPKSDVPTYENVGLKRINTGPDENLSKTGSMEQIV